MAGAPRLRIFCVSPTKKQEGEISSESCRARPQGLQRAPHKRLRDPPKNISGRGGQSRGEASRAQPVPGGTQPAHVAVSPPLLIVSLHLFMVVNCSLLRLLPYSERCS